MIQLSLRQRYGLLAFVVVLFAAFMGANATAAQAGAGPGLEPAPAAAENAFYQACQGANFLANIMQEGDNALNNVFAYLMRPDGSYQYTQVSSVRIKVRSYWDGMLRIVRIKPRRGSYVFGALMQDYAAGTGSFSTGQPVYPLTSTEYMTVCGWDPNLGPAAPVLANTKG